MSTKSLPTKQELANAIPSHCFVRSNLISFSYLLWDICLVSLGFYIGSFIPKIPTIFQYILWPIWWVIQGTLMTSLWVLAHEAGHRAFSESVMINDIVGFILHTILLVPFHSWRITHGLHHSYTAHMEKDQVFVPVEKGPNDKVNNSILATFLDIFAMLLIGWPLYLFFNFSGNRTYWGKRTNHFEPQSPLFHERQYWLIVYSNIGIIAMIGLLFTLGSINGLWWISKYYLFPYLVVNFWLVLITFLQHKRKDIEHFESSEWNFLIGALQTIDRDYGIVNIILHHITDTHVCHHIFHQIPFYHAQEATVAIKKALGDRYLYDDTPIMTSLWREMQECRFVEGKDIKKYTKN